MQILRLNLRICKKYHSRIQKIPLEDGGPGNSFVINVFQRGRTELLQTELVPIAYRWVSVPVFLREPIATCDFPVGGGPDLSPPPFEPPMGTKLSCAGYFCSLKVFYAMQNRQIRFSS